MEAVSRVKLWDKLQALTLLARHLRIFDQGTTAPQPLEKLVIQVQEVPAGVDPRLAGKG